MCVSVCVSVCECASVSVCVYIHVHVCVCISVISIVCVVVISCESQEIIWVVTNYCISLLQLPWAQVMMAYIICKGWLVGSYYNQVNISLCCGQWYQLFFLSTDRLMSRCDVYGAVCYSYSCLVLHVLITLVCNIVMECILEEVFYFIIRQHSYSVKYVWNFITNCLYLQLQIVCWFIYMEATGKL